MNGILPSSSGIVILDILVFPILTIGKRSKTTTSSVTYVVSLVWPSNKQRDNDSIKYQTIILKSLEIWFIYVPALARAKTSWSFFIISRLSWHEILNRSRDIKESNAPNLRNKILLLPPHRLSKSYCLDQLVSGSCEFITSNLFLDLLLQFFLWNLWI